MLGKPGVKVTADLGYQMDDGSGTGYVAQVVRSVTGVNKARVSSGGIYLYTYAFNSAIRPEIQSPAWMWYAPLWMDPSPSAAPPLWWWTR